MTYREEIDHAAYKAACLTRREYEATGLHLTVMDYDSARSAARDRGHDCCVNIDVDDRPTNVGAALLRVIDDVRVERGLPRLHAEKYKPRIVVN